MSSQFSTNSETEFSRYDSVRMGSDTSNDDDDTGEKDHNDDHEHDENGS